MCQSLQSWTLLYSAPHCCKSLRVHDTGSQTLEKWPKDLVQAHANVMV